MSRPMRQWPPEDTAEHQAMMATLRRRGKLGKPDVTINDSSGECIEKHVDGSSKCQLPLPDGAKPSPLAAALQWGTPQRNADGSGTLKDLTGTYTVLRERLSDGTCRYLAFKGSAVLAPACSTGECAKAHCSADYERMGGDNG